MSHGRAQAIEWLLFSKREALSSRPSPIKKQKLGLPFIRKYSVAHAYIPQLLGRQISAV
jgi:hypothetical protein